MDKKEEEIYEQFVCACGGPDDKERLINAEALVDQACLLLSIGSYERLPRSVTRFNLLSAVVYSLNVDFDANIESIHCDQWAVINGDQWAVITAQQQHYDMEKKEWWSSFSTHIECDVLEHGVAATWLAFANKFPEKLIGDSNE